MMWSRGVCGAGLLLNIWAFLSFEMIQQIRLVIEAMSLHFGLLSLDMSIQRCSMEGFVTQRDVPRLSSEANPYSISRRSPILELLKASSNLTP